MIIWLEYDVWLTVDYRWICVDFIQSTVSPQGPFHPDKVSLHYLKLIMQRTMTVSWYQTIDIWDILPLQPGNSILCINEAAIEKVLLNNVSWRQLLKKSCMRQFCRYFDQLLFIFEQLNSCSHGYPREQLNCVYYCFFYDMPFKIKCWHYHTHLGQWLRSDIMCNLITTYM